MRDSMNWKPIAVALGTLLVTAIIGLVSVVWAQSSEIAIQKERTDALRADIADMRASIEKKLDRIEGRLDQHLEVK